MTHSSYHREECHETPDLMGSELIPMNNLTATKKVEWSLNMVEALALLHNYDKGLVIHGKFSCNIEA